MTFFTRSVLALAALVAGASTAAAAPEVAGPPAPEPGPAFELVDGQWRRKPESCATPTTPAAGQTARSGPSYAAAQVKVWINTDGGDYVGAADTDAATNEVGLRQIVGVGEELTIPPMTDYDRDNLIACVTAHYAPFNVKIVDAEPESGPYIEAVVGGSGALLGDSQILGIASADNFCGVTERGIAFSFSVGHNGIPRASEELCATVAHEVGHLLALQHETLSTDLMSYVPVVDSDTKAFENRDSSCGTYPGNEFPCDCGGSTTNSAERLIEYVGEGAPACATEEDCFSGEVCTERGCVADESVEGGLGTECDENDACASGLCLSDDGDKHCAENCTPETGFCPEGYECREFEGGGACWAEGGGGGGGGCAASGSDGNPAMILLGLGVALAMSRRRRR